ncbi:MAG: hypothetical protein ACTSUE_14510 [Promethearchaeota archaeon]
MRINSIPAFLENYKTVLEPDKDQRDWWAGAPSILKVDGGNQFIMAARMREADAPRGRRGYEIRLLDSNDGINFKKIFGITKEQAGIRGFERPSIVQDPVSGNFRLYGCGEMEQGWGIWKLDDVDAISELDPKTLQVVLGPEIPEREQGGASEHHATFRRQYKDPFITRLKERWHMFVIGFDRVERTYHFKSDEGITWEQVGNHPIMDNVGWHNFFTRPACILPMKIGYILVYEGSNVNWRDPGYNIATGLAYSEDLLHFRDLTPDAPLLKSSTPGEYHTWRYSHWLEHHGEILVYFEAAKKNGSNEIRVARLPIS